MDAMRARSFTQKRLAELSCVSTSAISDYKTGKASPSLDQAQKLADALDLPEGYFYRPALLGSALSGPRLFRAGSGMTNRASNEAEAKLLWMSECLLYAERYLKLPRAEFLQEYKEIGDPLELTDLEIESIALSVRGKLGYGLSPVTHFVRTLEKAGVAILRYESLSSGIRIDGLSQHNAMGRPLCALFANEGSCQPREYFSLAHELGHLVLHSSIQDSKFDSLTTEKRLEDQANRFASAFLLPAKPFLEDAVAPTIKYFEFLKRKWRVSIAAMIRRSYQLGRIDKGRYTSLSVRMSQLRYRKREPYDDLYDVEKPVLLKQVFKTLVDREGVSPDEIVQSLLLNPSDLSDLSGLGAGYFSNDKQHADILEFPSAI